MPNVKSSRSPGKPTCARFLGLLLNTDVVWRENGAKHIGFAYKKHFYKIHLYLPMKQTTRHTRICAWCSECVNPSTTHSQGRYIRVYIIQSLTNQPTSKPHPSTFIYINIYAYISSTITRNLSEQTDRSVWMIHCGWRLNENTMRT